MGANSKKPPSRTGRRKSRSYAQRASAASALNHANELQVDSENIDPSSSAQACPKTKNSVDTIPLADHRRLLDNARRTIQRRDRKIEKQALGAQREAHMQKEEAQRLQLAHEAEMRAVEQEMHGVRKELHIAEESVARLERVNAVQGCTMLGMKAKLHRRQRTLDASKKRSARHSPEKRKQKEAKICERAIQTRLRERIYADGAYKPETRALMRELIRSGCSQKKAGGIIVEFGRLVGMTGPGLRCPSARSNQRFVAEGGLAADVQIVTEITRNSNITSSSDSTSFRNEDYESKCLALKALGDDGLLSDQQVIRAMSVDASLDHSSISQVDGFLASLARKFAVFNDSPYAKRHGLFASFQAFALVYKGTNGDHANDVKKDNKLLFIWKMDMTKTYLGNEYLKTISPSALLQLLVPFARSAIVDAGGSDAWARLSVDARNARNIDVMEKLARSLGEGIYEAKSEMEKLSLSRFLWAGCCMHKELNSVKGGDQAMRAFYGEHQDVPQPVLLANKDNAAVLKLVKDGEQLTDAEVRALAVSGCGAVKATTLGGMICNNKDSKKGQHDTYVWFFQETLGLRTSHVFPDVSNTRFQSHCDASCEIVLHLSTYRIFMQHVFWKKEKPGFTNIEQNFYNALHDIPTITEMCVLALYANSITYPYARHVRGPGTRNLNALDLGPYHIQLKGFVRKVIDDPELVLRDGVTLDNEEMYRPQAYTAILALRVHLPHLLPLFVAFMTGALEVWERFTSEFVEGGAIDQLGDEREEIFIPATNDANESGLGTKVASQRRRPNETLHQFNARFTFERNHTAGFMRNCFVEEDHKWLRRRARALLESLPQKAIRKAQVEHSGRVAAEHEEEKKKSAAVQADRRYTLENVVVISDHYTIEKKLGVPALKQQTDVWRHLKRAHMPMEKEIKTSALKKAELLRLWAQYPSGIVPEVDRVPLKDWEMRVGQPVGPTVTHAVLQSEGPVALAGSVAEGHSDVDLLYQSDDEDV
ncbi:hypothetical protein GGG16DRAFT_41336 [Schizophyllum commune]